MGNFSKTIRQRLMQPAASLTLPAGEQQIALADGRKFWVTRAERHEWAQLPAGAQLLLIRTSRRHLPWPLAVEMATIEQNRLHGPGPACLALAWGWLAPGEPDTRPATILRPHELDAVLRYELRETSCPDVVATILPLPN